MNKTNGAINSKHGLSKLMRPKFGPGMLLQHEDLEQLNVYTRELSRLMFQSLFGCGVMCGLVVDTEEKCGKMTVKVGKGVGLACSGDPIYVPDDVNVPIVDDCNGEVPNTFWVVLCATSKCCAPRTAICSSDDDDAASDCTREKDGWEIRLVNPRPPCACGCEEPATPNEVRVGETVCRCVTPYLDNLPHFNCYKAHYDGKCGCNCAECSDCDCQCILLARVDREGDTNNWLVDHRMRRFIRPVLMRDPQVEIEEKRRAQPQPVLNQQQRQEQMQALDLLPPNQQVVAIHQEVLRLQAKEREAQRKAKQQAAKQQAAVAVTGPDVGQTVQNPNAQLKP